MASASASPPSPRKSGRLSWLFAAKPEAKAELRFNLFPEIPESVQFLVLSYLSVPDLLSFGSVCCYAHTLASSDVLWKPLYNARYLLRAGQPDPRSDLQISQRGCYAHRLRNPIPGDEMQCLWVGTFKLVWNSEITEYEGRAWWQAIVVRQESPKQFFVHYPQWDSGTWDELVDRGRLRWPPRTPDMTSPVGKGDTLELRCPSSFGRSPWLECAALHVHKVHRGGSLVEVSSAIIKDKRKLRIPRGMLRLVETRAASKARARAAAAAARPRLSLTRLSLTRLSPLSLLSSLSGGGGGGRAARGSAPSTCSAASAASSAASSASYALFSRRLSVSPVAGRSGRGLSGGGSGAQSPPDGALGVSGDLLPLRLAGGGAAALAASGPSRLFGAGGGASSGGGNDAFSVAAPRALLPGGSGGSGGTGGSVSLAAPLAPGGSVSLAAPLAPGGSGPSASLRRLLNTVGGAESRRRALGALGGRAVEESASEGRAVEESASGGCTVEESALPPPPPPLFASARTRSGEGAGGDAALNALAAERNATEGIADNGATALLLLEPRQRRPPPPPPQPPQPPQRAVARASAPPPSTRRRSPPIVANPLHDALVAAGAATAGDDALAAAGAGAGAEAPARSDASAAPRSQLPPARRAPSPPGLPLNSPLLRALLPATSDGGSGCSCSSSVAASVLSRGDSYSALLPSASPPLAGEGRVSPGRLSPPPLRPRAVLAGAPPPPISLLEPPSPALSGLRESLLRSPSPAAGGAIGLLPSPAPSRPISPAALAAASASRTASPPLSPRGGAPSARASFGWSAPQSRGVSADWGGGGSGSASVDPLAFDDESTESLHARLRYSGGGYDDDDGGYDYEENIDDEDEGEEGEGGGGVLPPELFDRALGRLGLPFFSGTTGGDHFSDIGGIDDDDDIYPPSHPRFHAAAAAAAAVAASYAAAAAANAASAVAAAAAADGRRFVAPFVSATAALAIASGQAHLAASATSGSTSLSIGIGASTATAAGHAHAAALHAGGGAAAAAMPRPPWALLSPGEVALWSDWCGDSDRARSLSAVTAAAAAEAAAWGEEERPATFLMSESRGLAAPVAVAGAGAGGGGGGGAAPPAAERRRSWTQRLSERGVIGPRACSIQ